ncbi:MAG: hypothetical protein AAFR47_00565 [Pseudomonadota bacterium]
MTEDKSPTLHSAIASVVDAGTKSLSSDTAYGLLLETAANLIERVAYDSAEERSTEETVKLLTLAAELQRFPVSRLS